jgi:hypothetical protein
MIEPVVRLDDPVPLRRAIDAYLDGSAELTGLDLYYELERTTSLLTFHTMLRTGPRNRARSGLQQSYGDHNRLLMLALDRLVAGDLEWFRARIDADDPVDDDALTRCLERVVALRVPRDQLVALWLGAALHDCGMLCGRGASVDVEDGVVLSRPLIDAVCPEPVRDLARFVLHHHDYIKDVFRGEVPAALVAGEHDALPAELRPVGLAGLGLVQVAGSASLGEGRLVRSASTSSTAASRAPRSTTSASRPASRACLGPARRSRRPHREVCSSGSSSRARCTDGTV